MIVFSRYLQQQFVENISEYLHKNFGLFNLPILPIVVESGEQFLKLKVIKMYL
jgi:hypothetical protein